MIRQFHISDLKGFKANDFSGMEDNMEDFTNDLFFKTSIVDGPNVVCVVAFRRYWENNFISLLLISQDFRAVHARELKRFIDQAMVDFNCQRLQTESINCDMLNRWHKFLGFELEGTRRKLIFGKDFNMWAMFPKESN